MVTFPDGNRVAAGEIAEGRNTSGEEMSVLGATKRMHNTRVLKLFVTARPSKSRDTVPSRHFDRHRVSANSW
jgi:hypothetical protein